MKLKLWHIIYGVCILAIDCIFLALRLKIDLYLWILAGMLMVLLLLSYNILTSGQQSRANFYLDQTTGFKKDNKKIMPVTRFLIMIIPIALALSINYIMGV